MIDLNDVAKKYVVAVDEAELTVRIIEAFFEKRRPPGLAVPDQALDAMEENMRAAWLRAARAAMEYWRECIEGAQRPN